MARTNHRAGVLIQYTFLCDQTSDCLAIAYSQDSEFDARAQLEGHTCPQVHGSRGLIPTGKTLVQKMWDEADDALDAYKFGQEYKGMTGDTLMGFVKGIAEVLTFCTVPCYKVTEDVLRELNRRWKMRDGQISFAPTPSYSYHPHLDDARARSIVKETPEKPAAKPRASLRQAAEAAKPAEVQLTAAQRKTIRDTYHSVDAGFRESTAQMLAHMFNIPIERVIGIAGSEPVNTGNIVAVGALF